MITLNGFHSTEKRKFVGDHLQFQNPFEKDNNNNSDKDKMKNPGVNSIFQFLMNFLNPANLTSAETDVSRMLESGIDPWDEKIFQRLRKKDRRGRKASGLKVRIRYQEFKNRSIDLPDIKKKSYQIFHKIWDSNAKLYKCQKRLPPKKCLASKVVKLFH